MTPENIKKERVLWNSVYNDMSLAALQQLQEGDGTETLGLHTNPYWIPFSNDGEQVYKRLSRENLQAHVDTAAPGDK